VAKIAPIRLSVEAGVGTPADGRRESPQDGAGRRARHRRRPELPPAGGVVVAALAAASSVGLFVLLAVPVVRDDVSNWDAAVSEWIHSFENRDTPLDELDPFSLVLDPVVQALGLLLVLAIVGLLVRRGEARQALFLGAGVVGAAVLGLVLKEAFARPPVDAGGSGYSFPSGHAVRSLAAAAALGVVAWRTHHRRRVAIAGAAVVVLIGIAVVYHEWHWMSDVLAGWCLAVAWLAGVWLVVRPSPPARRAVA